MIDLYYWPTPNGWKVTILLEELEIDYRVIPVDIFNGQQFNEKFLRIAPNNKIPAIIDHKGIGDKPISIFESGAILLHYAEKTGQFLPVDPHCKSIVLQWLFFQMAHVGPMLGQNHHFRVYAPEKVPYAIKRYTKEASRIYSVIDTQLSNQEFIAGEYSIADIAIFPWLRGYKRQGQVLEDFPNLKKWYLKISERPAVQRGLAVMEEFRTNKAEFTDEQKSIMFGDKQFSQNQAG